MEHTFAISAYGDSPYLKQCIRSLLAQSISSEIILCTSTPSIYIEETAKRYGIPLYINTRKEGIASDWNFAYANASGRLVTIAHQDDVYHRDYTKTLLSYKEKYPDMSLFSSASITVKNGKPMPPGLVELVKMLLRLPLRCPKLNHFTWIKLLPLRFGNPIICPSCAYDQQICGQDLFQSELTFALDWEMCIKLGRRKGRFIVSEKPLIYYRVHEGAETKAAILDDRRAKEEEQIFSQMLPKLLVGAVKKLYRRSYDAYAE